jgi:Cu+-exporting ATPase
MALSSLSVVTNANRLRRFSPAPLPEPATPAMVEPRVEVGSEHDRPGDETVTDPVCGMQIRPSSAAARIHEPGHTVYFCSTGCRDAYAADPTACLTHHTEA